MKKQLLKLMGITVVAFFSLTINAQTVSTFENLTLSANSYWDGASAPMGTTFTDGDAIFPNLYDTTFGGFWYEGWAYTNKTDSVTGDYTNIYSARSGGGCNASSNYAIGRDEAIIRIAPNALGVPLKGVYVCNTTFAALMIQNGDVVNHFSRKFGDTTGTNSGLAQGTYPDWFKLSITGYRSGSAITDSVHFYLADYRFSNSTQDYIVKNWQWVDLSSLGIVDSVIFNLSSSDTAPWGMNTPSYFAIDNFNSVNLSAGISSSEIANVKLYPNPATDKIQIDLNGMTDNEAVLTIFDLSGRMVESMNVTNSIIDLPIANYNQGMYFISVKGDNTVLKSKFIKK